MSTTICVPNYYFIKHVLLRDGKFTMKYKNE